MSNQMLSMVIFLVVFAHLGVAQLDVQARACDAAAQAAVRVLGAMNNAAKNAAPQARSGVQADTYEDIRDFFSDMAPEARLQVQKAADRVTRFADVFKKSKRSNAAAAALADGHLQTNVKSWILQLADIVNGAGTRNIQQSFNVVARSKLGKDLTPVADSYNKMIAESATLRTFIAAVQLKLNPNAKSAKTDITDKDKQTAVGELFLVVKNDPADDMNKLAEAVGDDANQNLNQVEQRVLKVFPRAVVDPMKDVGLRLGRQLRQAAMECDEDAADAADVVAVLNDAVEKAVAKFKAQEGKMNVQQLSTDTPEEDPALLMVRNFFKGIRSSSRYEVARAVNWVSSIGEKFGQGGKKAKAAAAAFGLYGSKGLNKTAAKLEKLTQGTGTQLIVQALSIQEKADVKPVRYMDNVAKSYKRLDATKEGVRTFARTINAQLTQRTVEPIEDSAKLDAVKDLSGEVNGEGEVSALAAQIEKPTTSLTELGALIDKNIKKTQEDIADEKAAKAPPANLLTNLINSIFNNGRVKGDIDATVDASSADLQQRNSRSPLRVVGFAVGAFAVVSVLAVVVYKIKTRSAPSSNQELMLA